MEAVRELIEKLEAQLSAQEDASALLVTVRSLATEIESGYTPLTFTTRRGVSVLLPAGMTAATGAPVAASSLPAPQAEMIAPQPEKEAAAAENNLSPTGNIPEPLSDMSAEIPEKGNMETEAPAQETETRLPESYSIKPPSQPVHPKPTELPFNPLEDVPTLAQQSPNREVHELHMPGESLNDKLKTEEKELAFKLTDAPIKDLRKGIGINDRFLFISELFRGDEAMYERSIKTINAFHILPEAEYWINRELKVKIGWDDSIDTVQHFYQLVRRRFS
jgi:hypothetical protein